MPRLERRNGLRRGGGGGAKRRICSLLSLFSPLSRHLSYLLKVSSAVALKASDKKKSFGIMVIRSLVGEAEGEGADTRFYSVREKKKEKTKGRLAEIRKFSTITKRRKREIINLFGENLPGNARFHVNSSSECEVGNPCNPAQDAIQRRNRG